MGFYNDDQNKPNEQRSNIEDGQQQLSPLQRRLNQEELERQQREEKKNNKKGSKATYFLSALSGVVVGVLLMWLLMPSLANQMPGSSNTSTSVSTSDGNKVDQTSTVVTTDVTSAVDKASDAVVGISNYQTVQSSYGGFWFGQSGQDGQTNDSQQGELQEAGTGSGVIYKIDGKEAYIITNYHVVESAERLDITLADGTKKEAELVGSDIWTDLAVIKVKADGIETAISFGDSDVLKQGETVIAIGNPLGFDFYGSVTVGVISGTDRSVPVDLDSDGTEDWESEVLQTDAAINGGNSGGALVNLNGDLIGINSMKIADEQVEGLGFAIPINTVIPIVEQLEQNGEVKRPSMGITLMDLTDIPSFYQSQTLALPEDITTGVVVGEVVSGSAAEVAGMKQYDVIVEMDNQKIENAIDLRQHLYTETNIGDTISVKVYRAGKVENINLVLKES